MEDVSSLKHRGMLYTIESAKYICISKYTLMCSGLPMVWLYEAGPGQFSGNTKSPGIETLKYPTEGTPMVLESPAKQVRGMTSVRKGQAVAWRVASLVPAPDPLGPCGQGQLFPEAVRHK